MNKTQNKTERSITIGQAIKKIEKESKDNLANPQTDPIRIIESIINTSETGVMQRINEHLTQKQIDKLNDSIKRILNDEPIEYITGISYFCGHRIKISKDVLIPRVETEMLVELAIAEAYQKIYDKDKANTEKENPESLDSDNGKTITIVDVGTGSGCIILSIALGITSPVDLNATEISPKAIEIAKENFTIHGLEEDILLKQGNLLAPIIAPKFADIVVANLPYIPSIEMEDLPRSVLAFEPETALDGGTDGLKYVNEMFEQSVNRLRPDAVMLLELQPSTIEEAALLAKKYYPECKKEVINDQFDRQRFLKISV
ncbi:peptide chain release factor N(5)-glutamine methyltransferase [Candidatus Dojkabacteria bacterium]|nr:peptide chain release factor N(5)-glutamine methyltransferase [Candidatus Dojkabacteria bacterium]